MYTSAKEFGESIKRRHYQFEAHPEDLEQRKSFLREHYKNELEKSGYKFDRNYTAVETKFEEVIDVIVDEFYQVIPETTKKLFQEHFYFSTIDNQLLNASIHRSPDKRFFAVLINSALISLLVKKGKLDVALLNPECVVYCNRFHDRMPNREEIASMREELYNYFTTSKMGHGPFLVIKGDEAVNHFLTLDVQEKIIFFHEIGHFLNRDLFENRITELLNKDLSNVDHQREYLADLTGFSLLLRLESYVEPISYDRQIFILAAMIKLFDVMFAVQGGETKKYPHPLERMNFLVENYYGPEIADIVAKTYQDDKAWGSLILDARPKIQSRVQYMEHVVTNALNNCFDPANW